jgi:hypothetical protein
LSNRDTGFVPPRAIFTWAAYDIFDFLFCDAMVENMRLASFRIAIETDIHASHPWITSCLQQPDFCLPQGKLGAKG